MQKLLRLPENLAEVKEIIGRIDFSDALSPHESSQAVIEACDKVKRYGFATVCVYPTWVKLAKAHMEDSSQGILVVVGFPHGSTTTEAKVAETRKALDDGATEIDMVINIARFLDEDYEYVRNEIKAVVDTCRTRDVGVKVILEVGYLNDEQKRIAARLALEAGAEYVKTCTGFGPGRATLHDVMLLMETVDGAMKVKASGGVASLEDQWAFIQAGASRVAGRSVIIQQLESIGYIPS